MNKEIDIKDMAPVKASERHVILDALRGFALLGICFANFPEFSLYTFQKPEITEAMPTAEIDKVIRFLQYLFVDGKFYTIFSLLFGIGFSIIISNAAKKGTDGFRIFYRRMIFLAAIGFLHLMFIWSGDIRCRKPMAARTIIRHWFSASDVYLEWGHLVVVCLIGHVAPSFPACFGQSVAGDFRCLIATSYSD